MNSQNSLSLQAKKFVKTGENKYHKLFITTLKLCLHSHQLMIKEGEVLDGLDENILSNKLCRIMQDNKCNKSFGLGKFHFVREAAEINKEDDSLKGFHDIRAIIPNRSIYSSGSNAFVIECKRANGDSEKNRLYIEEGINRFIDNKYTSYENMAGVIGFVESHKSKKSFPEGKINNIVKDINSRLEKDFSNSTKEKMTKIAIDESNEYTYSSLHTKSDNSGEIKLFHLMLDNTVAS